MGPAAVSGMELDMQIGLEVNADCCLDPSHSTLPNHIRAQMSSWTIFLQPSQTTHLKTLKVRILFH